MKVVYPNSIQFIVFSCLCLACNMPVLADAPLPTAVAMEPLIGMPYSLFASQRQTDSGQALNCFTSVIHALRRSGYACLNMNVNQGLAFWWPRAQPLRLGETRIAGDGMMLMTRSHFLLLHTDANANGLIDKEDLVIHAYYRPVQIDTIQSWMQEGVKEEIRYIPVDGAFPCPTASALAGLKRGRRPPSL